MQSTELRDNRISKTDRRLLVCSAPISSIEDDRRVLIGELILDFFLIDRSIGGQRRGVCRSVVYDYQKSIDRFSTD